MRGPNEPIALGATRVLVDGDLITWITGPEITPEEMVQAHALLDEQLARYGYICMLAELKDLVRLNAETRRAHTEWTRARRPYLSVALIEGGLLARVLVRLVLTASQLITRDDRTRFEYFDSEAQALAWLGGERTRLRRLVSAAGSGGRP
jgi:hypothetical protein